MSSSCTRGVSLYRNKADTRKPFSSGVLLIDAHFLLLFPKVVAVLSTVLWNIKQQPKVSSIGLLTKHFLSL